RWQHSGSSGNNPAVDIGNGRRLTTPLPPRRSIMDNLLCRAGATGGRAAGLFRGQGSTMNPSGTNYESSLLLTLGEITQLVVHSRDAAETLSNIVRLIQGRFKTAVCSVYVLEQERGE